LLSVECHEDEKSGVGDATSEPVVHRCGSIFSLLQTNLAMQTNMPLQADHIGHDAVTHAHTSEDLSNKSEPRDYVLLAHHKGGWEMSHLAAAAMAGVADEPDSLIYDNITHSFAIDPAEIATPKASCWLHVIRNPFEMIVSAYVYHAAGSEEWANTPFGRYPNKSYLASMRHHLKEGLIQMRDNAISGPLDWLPDPTANESYAQWLRRVDLDDGLLAEAIGVTNKSLSSLEFTNGFLTTESQSCNVKMCFINFYEHCNASWHQVLNAWQIPENRSHRMHTAATSSCPGVSPIAAKHSSDNKGNGADFKHPPEHEMVQRLRELDRLHLGGRIAEVEKRFNCPVFGKYAGPTSG
jgi:hypothetical protein